MEIESWGEYYESYEIEPCILNAWLISLEEIRKSSLYSIKTPGYLLFMGLGYNLYNKCTANIESMIDQILR